MSGAPDIESASAAPMRTPWGWVKHRDATLRAKWERQHEEARARLEATGPSTAPTLGTPEGRARLRASGVPLDEWVDPSSPSWRARMAAEAKSERRAMRAFVAVLVAAAVGMVAWSVANPEPLPSERSPACAAGSGLPCTFTAADGTLMVRHVTAEGGTDVSTARSFDEGYLDWQHDSHEEPRGRAHERLASEPGRPEAWGS